MKPVGKPDAGKPHVRFDERGWETELLAATAPILDFTSLSGYSSARAKPWTELRSRLTGGGGFARLLSCTWRRDWKGPVVSPISAGRNIPPLACDRPIGTHPEDVEVIGHPRHWRQEGSRPSGAGRRDWEGPVVSPVGAGRSIPPLGCDRPVGTHPEDVEVVGHPRHGGKTGAGLGGAGRRDRERLVVSPVGAGRAVPPLSCDRPVRAHPEDVEAVWASGLTAATAEPGSAASGRVIAKGWWSPQLAPGAPSHH